MRSTLSLMLLVGLSACAKPTVVDVAMPGDERLTCAQLENEYSTASRLIREAESEKGATGGNVTRFLFFWPAIVGTSMLAIVSTRHTDGVKESTFAVRGLRCMNVLAHHS